MGAALALYVALRCGQRLGGAIVCSGWLPLRDEYPKAMPKSNRGLRVFQVLHSSPNPTRSPPPPPSITAVHALCSPALPLRATATATASATAATTTNRHTRDNPTPESYLPMPTTPTNARLTTQLHGIEDGMVRVGWAKESHDMLRRRCGSDAVFQRIAGVGHALEPSMTALVGQCISVWLSEPPPSVNANGRAGGASSRRRAAVPRVGGGGSWPRHLCSGTMKI